ncbi:MAG: glycosyltransferase family 1 protein [Magnetococcales bacterium]|nr:glycosyltransferase family 1 protein [Magnetococcales bacterium]
MRIILIESGTYETFTTLAAQLVAMGHEVYDFCVDETVIKGHLAAGYTVEPFLDQAPDLVITANFFLSREVNHLIRHLIPGDFPVVNLTWGHPVAEVEPILRRAGDVPGCNAQLRENRLFLWIPCPFAAEEYARLGFANGFYAPLGGFGFRLAQGHQYRWMRWGEPFADLRSLPVSTGEVHGKKPEAYDLIYLGDMPEPPTRRDERLEAWALETATACVARPQESRLQQQEPLREMLIADGSIRSVERFLCFQQWFFQHHARLTRQSFVHAVAREFGARFLLYGDAWIAQGLAAHPRASVARKHFYQRIPLSVDFGSMSFETCFFPRTIEIIKSGGTLLGYRRPDSAGLFASLPEAPVFDNEEALLQQARRLLAEPETRDRCRAAQWELVNGEQVAARGLARMIEAVFQGEISPFAPRS